MWTYLRKIMCVLGLVAGYKMCVADSFTIGFAIFVLVGVVNYLAIRELGA